MTTTKEKLIQDYLLADEISPHYSGFHYLVSAIDFYRPFESVTKYLYPRVADKHCVVDSQVERNIRTALKMSGLSTYSSEYIARAALAISREDGCA